MTIEDIVNLVPVLAGKKRGNTKRKSLHNMPYVFVSSTVTKWKFDETINTTGLTRVIDWIDVSLEKYLFDGEEGKLIFYYSILDIDIPFLEFECEIVFQYQNLTLELVKDIVKTYHGLASGLLTIKGLSYNREMRLRHLSVYNIDYSEVLKVLTRKNEDGALN